MSTSVQFVPPLAEGALLIFLAACAVAAIALRFVGGRAVEPARRWGLLCLRGAVVVTLLMLLSGPVRVDESSGVIERPDLFVLVDASRSMDIGKEQARWQDAIDVIDGTLNGVADETMLDGVQLFRFGHRLQAVDSESPRASELPEGSPDATTSLPFGLDALIDEPPTDSDTRLAEALRQLSARFGRRPPAGIVLLSDGRVRDTSAVEHLAGHFAAQDVPIHTYPMGSTERGGDIAIVSAVVPQYVRKYSDVEVQVFFRSFGYTGRRTTVQIVVPAQDGRLAETLTEIPITLSGGAQSLTISFRSSDRGRDFEIRIPAEEGELTERNNVLPASIGIDRTKIRVLYIEGSDQPIRATQNASSYAYAGAHSFLENAVTEDEDIECVTLVQLPGSRELMRIQSASVSSGTRRGFPESVAELAAFDCVILSDVASTMFTDEQLEWLAHWIENRGGGLCMTGGPDSYSGGGWEHTPIGPMLPVAFSTETWTPTVTAEIVPASDAAARAIWHIVSDRRQNQQILESLPAIGALHQHLEPNPLSTVLATCTTLGVEPSAAAVAGRFGRGRTLALAFPVTEPHAQNFQTSWGTGGNRNASKFLRNVVYWVSEGSMIGRRRLVAGVDKQFYRPGEVINLRAVAYDETAYMTKGYELWAMIDPQTFDFDDDSVYAPVHWPNGVPRESGDDSPYISWGEEFPLARAGEEFEYRLPLELSERLRSGASDQGLRIELTAYENTGQSFGFSRGTQVDSTSVDVQILDDPFEHQNPFPNHDLLRRVASVSGGRVLASPGEMIQLVVERPATQGPPVIRTTPLWSRWWLLAALIGLLTIEWFWRRTIGLA